MGERMSLIGGFLVPLPSLGIVLWHTLTIGIEQAELVLGCGLSLLRQRLSLTQRHAVVVALIGLFAGFEVRPCRRGETDD